MESVVRTARRALTWWLGPRQHGDEANAIRVRFMVLGWLAMLVTSGFEAAVEASELHSAAPALITAVAALVLLVANRAGAVAFPWLVHTTLVLVVLRFELLVMLDERTSLAAIVWLVLVPVIASITIGLRGALTWLAISLAWLARALLTVTTDRPSTSNLSGFVQIATAVGALAFAFFVLDREHRRSNDQIKRAIAARELVLAKLSHEAKTPLHQLINALDAQANENGDVGPHLATALQAAGQLSLVLHDVFQQAKETTGLEAEAPTIHLETLELARVLVVDDNPINLRMAATMLERLRCRVETAAGGSEAVEAVTHGGFDLVVMDCHMPEVDGFEATRQIRAGAAPTRDVPIIALTASSDPEDANRAREAGMNGFLEKPLRQQDLERLLRAV
ncbi:MAG: response regulator [Myxococcaceae bacterium]